jgi:flagellin-like protein
MDTRKPSIGVSPIIATLLLIAITVSAGIIVYVFVSGLSNGLTQGGGTQTSEQIELTSYSFVTLTGTGCGGNTTVTAPCINISIKDAGGGAVTIDSIYFDGLPLTPNAALVTTPITLSTHGNANILLAHGASFTSGGGYTGLPASAAITAGSSHVLKIVTKTGGLFSYTITAGTSQ